MCGVVGFWHKDGKKADEKILQKMVHRLAHRGPDDHGIWSYQSLGLGHTRLSILDLSKNGHQPFITNDGNGVLSYNGEIYNYMDLRLQLQKEGVVFKSTSDTEVLLYALHLWGPQKAIPLLEGMFAFAYFDLRSQTLWLARDRAGIKPLYWIDKGHLSVFASEMKALFDHPDVPCRADMHSLTTLILYRRLDGDWTPFEDVKCVLPGTLVKVTEQRSDAISYFDLLRDVNVDRIIQSKQIPFDQILSAFEENFSHSVKSHLISDTPVATMCSGGVDSSLITAAAKEVNADLVAYVAEVEGYRINEAQKAQQVCDHINVPLRRIKVSQEEYIRSWPEAAYYNDQPNFFAQNVYAMLVSKAAYKDGFKVLITGEGSDELFGGYPLQAEAYHMWRLRRLHSMVVPNNPFFKKLGHYFSRLAPFDLPNLMKHPFTHMDDMSPMQGSIGQLASLDGIQRRLRSEQLFKKLERITPLEERAFLAKGFEDFHTHLRTLLCANDKMSMAVSVEARVPFLSNQLIDFGLHLNCHSKYNRKISKRVVKVSAEKKLPHTIVHAEKIGFGYSNSTWKKGVDFLKKGMVPHLFKWGEREAKAIYEDLEADRSHLFPLMSVELWAQIYLNHEDPQSLSEKLLANLL